MNCNGINFSNEWLDKFDTAEAFASHEKQQHYVERNIVTNETLISFFNLFLSQKPKANEHINSGVQEQVQEDKPEGGDSRNGKSESRRNSGSAGNSNEPRGESRRK